MQEHLVLVLEDEAEHGACDAATVAARVHRTAELEGELAREGVLRDAGQLRPSREGGRVTATRGRAEITRGPFAAPTLAAYQLVRAENVDAATAIAARRPRGPRDAVEVHTPIHASMRADKASQPGKVFAFGVLGAAASEPAWMALMDRIAIDTRERFPPDVFLGGLRLGVPSAGRRIAPVIEGGLVTDGPFLESKEVIGGLCFLRLPGMDEAIAWAKGSGFVPHGTLEIRELWRT